jgi:cobalt/nickel transport system permease protein
MSILDADLIDRHAYQDSVIQRLDPRAKLLATMFFIISVVSFPKYAVGELFPFFLFPMTMAIFGFVPAKLLFRQLALASPFIILVGLFNPFLDRTPVHLNSFTINAGWLSFMSILLRGALCVASAVILIATTSFPRLVDAMRFFKIPSAFAVQLMLLYRYLFVLLGEAQKINHAFLLRSGNSRPTIAIAGSALSSLLIRTINRGEAIWNAMQARGFEGDILTSQQMKWKAKDSLFLCAVLVLSVLFRIFPLNQLLASLVRT